MKKLILSLLMALGLVSGAAAAEGGIPLDRFPVAKLTDLRERENEADLAKNLETEQMGQRLSLIEPPPMPTTPVSISSIRYWLSRIR